MNKSAKVQVLMSGGIDSAACARFLLDQGLMVSGLFIRYGQPAVNFEAASVARLGHHLDIPLKEITLVHTGVISSGEVVGRNLQFIATALSFGEQASAIAIGIHAGTDYWDCGTDFIELTSALVERASCGTRSLIAPFLNWTKRDVFDFAVSRGVPIDMTYSCEAGHQGGCGACQSCLDRSALGCLQQS